MKGKPKKTKDDSSEEEKVFIGAKEGDEQTALEKYIKSLDIDYDTDWKGIFLKEKIPKKAEYKLG